MATASDFPFGDLPDDFECDIDGKPTDKEAYVITVCVTVLGELPEAGRDRVLSYLLSRFVRVSPEAVKEKLPDAKKEALAEELRRLVEAGVIVGPSVVVDR